MPASPPATGTGGRRWLVAFALGLVIATALAGSLASWNIYFHADDFGMVQYYWPSPERSFRDVLAIDFLSEQSIWGEATHELRPLMAWTVRFSTWATGIDPRGHHAVNITLHVLASVLVFVAARRLVGVGLWGATFAGALFSALPVHAEAIEWMAGRAESLMAVCLLGAMIAYVEGARRPEARVWRWTGYAAFVLALLSKEVAVTFPGLIVLWDVAVEGMGWRRLRGRLVHWAPYGGILAAYFLVRWYALPPGLPGEGGLVSELAIFAARQPFYLAALFSPRTPLPPQDGELGMAAVTSGALVLGSVLLAAMIVLLVAVALRPARFGRRFRLATFFGPGWYLGTLLVTLVSYASERHLYVTAAGMCLAFVCVPLRPATLSAWQRRIVVGLGVGVVLFGVVSLRAALSRSWERGEISRLTQVGIVEAARRLPEGSQLVLLPDTGSYDTWVWRWALPFALQPPFTDRDLYRVDHVIEHRKAYCCPIEQWWEHRARNFQLLLSEGGPPAFLLYWDAQAGALRTRGLGLDELRARLTAVRVAGGRPAHGDPPVTYGEGVFLMRTFEHHAGPLD